VSGAGSLRAFVLTVRFLCELGLLVALGFDAMESRFDGLAARLDAHLDRHTG
jgi:hypothetical protein